MEKLKFEPLKLGHFAKIHEWFNKSHVQAFYSLRAWTLEEVHRKLTPYLLGEKHLSCFVIFDAHNPLGYIQSYPVKDHPWENQDLSQEFVLDAAGIDLFIGDENYLGKGFGAKIIEQFLEKYIWPYYRYCLADPDIRNATSISLFQKCGFANHKQVFSEDALQRKVALQLCIKERDAHIRELHAEDLKTIIDTFCFPWTTPQKTSEKWEKYLYEQYQGKRKVYLLEKQKQLIGYASLCFFPEYPLFKKTETPEIHDLWIEERYRNRGFGKMLIAHLEKMARNLGYKQIGLGVGLYADYGPAQMLYSKLGYIPDGNGVTCKSVPVTPGQSYTADDDLVLWLIKSL